VLASPVEAVLAPGSRAGLNALVALVRREGVERVLVGLPLSLSGADSAQTREARQFAAALTERLGGDVPVELHDERFTTKLARGAGGSAGEDSRAAAHLLQSWLDAQR
jgi:putative Holliday junction resolvase